MPTVFHGIIPSVHAHSLAIVLWLVSSNFSSFFLCLTSSNSDSQLLPKAALLISVTVLPLVWCPLDPFHSRCQPAVRLLRLLLLLLLGAVAVEERFPRRRTSASSFSTFACEPAEKYFNIQNASSGHKNLGASRLKQSAWSCKNNTLVCEQTKLSECSWGDLARNCSSFCSCCCWLLGWLSGCFPFCVTEIAKSRKKCRKSEVKEFNSGKRKVRAAFSWFVCRLPKPSRVIIIIPQGCGSRSKR